MSNGNVPLEVKELLRIYDPTLKILATRWHSPRCLTMTAVSPNHHAHRVRWNLGDSGRWTLIPVSQAKLIVGPVGW